MERGRNRQTGRQGKKDTLAEDSRWAVPPQDLVVLTGIGMATQGGSESE